MSGEVERQATGDGQNGKFSDREQSQEEEPHNNGFNSQEDDRPRKSQAEMDDQAQARGRELKGRASRRSMEEDRDSTVKRDRLPR